jgi:pSer/pThr/pTyr-binding forkhead associated (FHA) protein
MDINPIPNNTPKNNEIILRIINGLKKGTEFKIDINNSNKSFILGRNDLGSEAFFKLANIDKYVSRNHCIFEVFGKDVYLIDNNSLNGTWLYRKGYFTFKKIMSKIKLKDRDIILIGNTNIFIRIILNNTI